LGQKGTLSRDLIGPESVELLCRGGDRVWGVYRVVPERYYAGYVISAGCLASRSGGGWQGRFDVRTAELELGGEQPELMLISLSHGEQIVLAEGQPAVVGIENVAARAWVVGESGLFAYDAGADKFAPAMVEATRLYWRASAAAADAAGVWFGGDGGTVSRLDRKTGRVDLVGVAPGRKIVGMTTKDGALLVQTAKSDAVLPVSLKSATRLPEGEVLAFDGKTWSTAAATSGDAPRTAFKCEPKGNYLLRGQKRVAFLKGVFRPAVLCEDPAGGKLWLSAYSGVASVPLPAGDAK
jgi:hypothetical protein